MRNKLMLLLSVLVIGSMLLAACGGGAPAAPAAEAPAAEAPAEEAAAEAPAEEATEAPAEEAAAEAPAEEAAAEATEAPAEEAAPASTDCAAKLVVWADDQRAPVLLSLSERFQAETGVCLEVVQKQFGAIRDDVKVAGPAGQGPDIMIGAHDWIGELVNSGLLAEVSLGDNAANFAAEATQACSYSGKLYGMPYAVENVALYYNPELVPTAPATWDEVKTISEELQAAGNKYGFLIQENDPYHFYPIQTAFGGYVFGKNEDGSWNPNDVGIGSEGTVASFGWLDSMYEGGQLDRGSAINYDLMNAAFQNGDAAIMIGGPWMLDGLRGAGVPYAIAKLPAGTQDAKPFLGVQCFMVSAFSQQGLLAQTFLQQFVATDETMQAIVDANLRPSAWIPVNEKLSDPDIKAFAEAGLGSDAMPNIPQMSAVWSSWGTAMQLVSQGKQTAEEAAAEAQAQIVKAISGQ